MRKYLICAALLLPASAFAQAPLTLDALNTELREVQDSYDVCFAHIDPAFAKNENDANAKWQPGWENCAKVRTKRAGLIAQRKALFDKAAQDKIKNMK